MTGRHFLILVLVAFAGCGNEQVSMPTPAVDAGPSTGFSVGSRTIFVHDASRAFDTVAGVDAGIRSMVAEIWYPVEPTDTAGHRRATYGDYVFGNRDMHRLMMTATTFFHLTPDTVRDGVTQVQIDTAIDELFDRQRGSYVAAPLASSVATFPVVVMSHGDAGSRYNMESACEYLAAHGYIVIAAEHTGNSPFAMIGADPALQTDEDFRAAMSDVLPLLNEHGAYGSPDTFGQSYSPLLGERSQLEFLQYLDASLLQRLNDLRAVVAELDQLNTDGAWQGRLELKNIGLMGRSFGGATTVMGLAMEPRFSAGFAVVPPVFPDPRSLVPAEMLVRQGESVLLAAEGAYPLTTVDKPAVLLSGAEDSLIIGMAAASAVTATPQNPHPMLREIFEETSAPVVWGLLADSDHGSFGVSGPYWWPQLKPDTKSRHFSPQQTFKLVDAQLAHWIQRELALAFFDWAIRGDTSAIQRLQDNAHEDAGLSLELRNF